MKDSVKKKLDAAKMGVMKLWMEEELRDCSFTRKEIREYMKQEKEREAWRSGKKVKIPQRVKKMQRNISENFKRLQRLGLLKNDLTKLDIDKCEVRICSGCGGVHALTPDGDVVDIGCVRMDSKNPRRVYLSFYRIDKKEKAKRKEIIQNA